MSIKEVEDHLKQSIPEKIHRQWEKHFIKYGKLPEIKIEKYLRKLLKKKTIIK